MATIGADIDEWIAKATPDDGESWWATTRTAWTRPSGSFLLRQVGRAARVVHDDRYQWIGDLTGDGHKHKGGGEGLVKPLGIVRGLSDLPWHKDCGQGLHWYNCSGLTCGISVTRFGPRQRRARRDPGDAPTGRTRWRRATTRSSTCNPGCWRRIPVT